MTKKTIKPVRSRGNVNVWNGQLSRWAGPDALGAMSIAVLIVPDDGTYKVVKVKPKKVRANRGEAKKR